MSKTQITVHVHSMVLGNTDRGRGLSVLFLCLNKKFNHPLLYHYSKNDHSYNNIFNYHNDLNNYYVYSIESPEARGFITMSNSRTRVNLQPLCFEDGDIIYKFNGGSWVDNSYEGRLNNRYTYSLHKYFNIKMTHFNTSIDWWLPYRRTNGLDYGGNYILRNEMIMPIEMMPYDLIKLEIGTSRIGTLLHRNRSSLLVYSMNESALAWCIKSLWNEELKFIWTFEDGQQHVATLDLTLLKFKNLLTDNSKVITKFEMFYMRVLLFRYNANSFSYAKTINIDIGNLNAEVEPEQPNNLEYGIYVNHGNININDDGTTTMNHAKITGSAVFNDLRVEVPRRVILNFKNANGQTTQYQGDWDLSNDLVINIGCEGNCSSACTGTCTGSCSLSCTSTCTGSCSSGCSNVCDGFCN